MPATAATLRYASLTPDAVMSMIKNEAWDCSCHWWEKCEEAGHESTHSTR